MSNENAGGEKTKSGKKFENVIWARLKSYLADNVSRIVFDDTSGLTWLKSSSVAASQHRGIIRVEAIDRGFLCSQDDFYNFLAENYPSKAANKKESNSRKQMFKARISKTLNPDMAFFDFEKRVLIILEIKAQSSEGSVDEKLETVDFKRKQYSKLIQGTEFDKVEFKWILDSKFRDEKYDDVKTYIRDMGSDYLIDDISLNFIGI